MHDNFMKGCYGIFTHFLVKGNNKHLSSEDWNQLTKNYDAEGIALGGRLLLGKPRGRQDEQQSRRDISERLEGSEYCEDVHTNRCSSQTS